MKTEFLKQFNKDLHKITFEKVKNEIYDVIINVETSEKTSEIKNLKKLPAFKNAYRIKTGDYRIGVFIENNTVEFVRILHRKDIYKVFP
ncbi:MAG: type II toxin-antitoxin system RelE family toxin [Bacteroidales bacterium]